MGLEYLSQPQVFLQPITAVGGIQNGLYGSSIPPLYTSFYTWTSTSELTATTFPLTGIETLTNRSGSFIVTVGGVLQSPETYTIDVFNRTLTFDTPVNDNTTVLITQIGTIAVSSQSISELTATNSFFNNIIGINSLLTNITAYDSNLINATVTNLNVLSSQFFGTTIFDTVTATNLIVLSAITQVQETIITPTSAISLTAIGPSTFEGTISATDVVTFDSDLIVGGTIYTQSGNSNLWDYNTTLLQSNSSKWESTYQTVCALSGFWEETADINTISTFIALNSSSWSAAYATTTALSSNLWNDVYTNVQNNSANWDAVYTTTALSSNLWNDVYTVVQTSSSSWEETADITAVSTLLQNNSANWDTAYTVTGLSSELWNISYTLVQENSSSWEESADILPTVTNYLSTNSVVINTLYVTSLTALSSQFDQTIYTITTSESITATNLNVTNQILSAGVDLLNIFLTSETDAQTLTFNELTKDLEISSGNTISLSSLFDETTINTVSGLLTPLTVYQNASSNWQSTYETVSALSAFWEESADILPTVTNYLSTSNVLLSGLTTESITITSNEVFGTTNYVNTVSALAITINGTLLYLPLLSAI